MKSASGSIAVAVLASLLLGASPGGCTGGPNAAATAASGGGSGEGNGGSGSNGGGGSTASADVARAALVSYQEVPANSTTGHGTLQLTRSADGTTFTFELTYADLQGNAGGGAVTGAHIHLGQRGVSGGIAVDLCGAGGRPACPDPPATVTGTFAAADVVAIADQGLAAGDLDALIRAAKAGVTYVNVHTTMFPKGEIRGQIRYRAFGDHGDGSGDGEGDHGDD